MTQFDYRALSRAVRPHQAKLTPYVYIIALFGIFCSLIGAETGSIEFIAVGLSILTYGYIEFLFGFINSWLLAPDRLMQFANDNNLTYSKDKTTELKLRFPNFGYSVFLETFSNIIMGKIFDHDFTFFRVSIIRDDAFVGANQNVAVHWVLNVKLRKQLPSFIIDARLNSTKLTKKYKEYTEVKLESYFSEGFRLLVPKGKHIDVLSVVGPDLMDKVMEFWEIADIIVEKDEIFIIGGSARSNKAAITEDLFVCAETILPDLIHSSTRYNPNN